MIGLLVVVQLTCEPIYLRLATIYGIVQLVCLLEPGVRSHLIGYWQICSIRVG